MKRWLLAALMFVTAAAQAQYVTLTGAIQASNGLTASNYTVLFTPTQSFFVAGTAVIINTTTSCATSNDGSVVGLPNPLLSTTIAPGFTGTLPPGNYYVQFAYYKGSTVSLPSPEMNVQVTSTGNFTLQPPAGGVPAGADGMKVYVSTTSGTENLQGSTIANAVYNQSTPLISGALTPTTNNTVCQQVANDAGWPTGTGYKVSLIDPNGNAVPGYPMQWQLLGAGSTLNLSNGLPYYHGIVTFPSPIIASPINHNLQSISGPLDMQGYDLRNVGKFMSCTVNGMLNAASSCFPGADIGAKINSALSVCAQQCSIYVPAGNYNFTTQIVLPLNFFSQFTLLFDRGAVGVYSGSSDMILFPVAGAGPTNANCSVQGGSFFGSSSSAPSAVHIMATNTCKVSDMLISGFASGAGIWLDGTNSVNVIHNLLASNKVGVYMTNTWCNGTVCGPHPSFGSSFSANANHVTQNTIIGNTNWGVQLFDVDTNSNTGALNDIISENNLELNGSAGPTFGALSAGRSRGLIIKENYFEGSPVVIQLGIPGGSDGSTRFFAAQGPVIRDNYFTIEDTLQTPPAGTYQINLLDTSNALIEGNSALSDTQSSLNCFINTLANNGTNIGETGTRIGKNSVQLTGGGAYTCVGGVGQQLVGAGSYIEMNPNYLSLLVNQAFQVNTAVTSETIGVQNLTTSGSCQLQAIAGNSTGINNGRATLLAGTTYLSALTTNQVTITHPSGQAIFVDLYCTLSPVGGFGIP